MKNMINTRSSAPQEQHAKIDIHRFVDLSSFPDTTFNPLEFLCAGCNKRFVLVEKDDFWKIYVLTRYDPSAIVYKEMSYYCCSSDCANTLQKRGITRDAVVEDPDYERKRLRGLVDHVFKRDGGLYEEKKNDCQDTIFHLLSSGIMKYGSMKTLSYECFFKPEGVEKFELVEQKMIVRHAIDSMNEAFMKHNIEYEIKADDVCNERHQLQLGLFRVVHKKE